MASKFDSFLLKYLGEWGAYQKFILVLLSFPTSCSAIHLYSWVFTGALSKHRCRQLGEDEPLSFATNFSLPEDSTCKRFVDGNGSSVEPCLDGYVWDYSEIQSTAVSRWEIVCGNGHLRAAIQSLYYVGQFFGSFLFGYFADRIGRKPVFFLAIGMQICCGTAMAFVPFWQLFALFRLGLGLAHPGVSVIGQVIAMELVGPRKRVLASVIRSVFYEAALVILTILAYYIRYYETLQLAISLPALLLLSYWWIFPESPRWLMSIGKFKEANRIIEKMAFYNKKELPENWREMLEEPEDDEKEAVPNYTLFDVFRNKTMRKRALICFVCWPVVSMTYYGLSMNPSFLGGDRYTTFILSAVISIPGYFSMICLAWVVPRRYFQSGGFFIASLCLLSTLLIPEDIIWLRFLQVVVSKTAVAMTYTMMYIYTPELFPTPMRATVLGMCSMVARIGSTSSSYFAMWLVYKSRLAMVLFFGICTLIAGSLTLLLPETQGKALPSTIEEAEEAAVVTKVSVPL